MLLARVALWLIGAAVVLFVLVRLLEPRLAFFPLRGEPTTPADFGLPYEALTLATADGEQLRAWSIGARADPPRGTVVYFHGNGGHLSMWAPIVCAIARRGYAVLAVDYRGYGASTGRPTEAGLYRDVDAVVAHLAARAEPAGPVVYWGRSLGVAMAGYAATRRRPAGVILESGFPDARSLFRPPSPLALLALFASYRFPAARFLREAPAPALVLHGDADRIVPYAQGRALYEQLTGPKEFFTIRGGDHNDAAPPDPAAYWGAVDAFVARL